MFKLGIYLLIAFLAWNLYEETEAESEVSQQFRCVLRNPDYNCAGFCFARLKRFAYHIELHEQRWNMRYAFSLNKTQERLDRMELQQTNIESHLADIQSTLDVIRETRKP